MGVILIYDGAGCPSGYTRFSAADTKFPRGASTPGGTGAGSSGDGVENVSPFGGGMNVMAAAHVHTILPAYVDYLFCEDNADNTLSLLPLGAIFLWEDSSSCPSGSERVSALDNKFPRGVLIPGGTGGSTTTGLTNVGSNGSASDPGAAVPAAGHTHTGWPAYYDFLFCKKV